MSVLPIFCCLFVIGAIGSANAACPGCPESGDSNDPEIRNLLTKVVKTQNAKSNDEDIDILGIEKVTTQVVAGIKYVYDFRGQGQQSKKAYTCHAVLVHQPWISPEPQVLEYSCTPNKSKRSL